MKTVRRRFFRVALIAVLSLAASANAGRPLTDYDMAVTVGAACGDCSGVQVTGECSGASTSCRGCVYGATNPTCPYQDEINYTGNVVYQCKPGTAALCEVEQTVYCWFKYECDQSPLREGKKCNPGTLACTVEDERFKCRECSKGRLIEQGIVGSEKCG